MLCYYQSCLLAAACGADLAGGDPVNQSCAVCVTHWCFACQGFCGTVVTLLLRWLANVHAGDCCCVFEGLVVCRRWNDVWKKGD